jgi:SAM-dependent methyltransferase
MTRALAAVFREVHAVDISGEMVALARRNLSDLPNVFLHNNNGTDLAELPGNAYDFAFSFIVFQHIPNRDVIQSYVCEVHRCLKPGAVFKFQVNGNTDVRTEPDDTWVGATISLADAHALAARCGFELIANSGAGTQYFWLWFRKLPVFTGDLRFWCAIPVGVTFSPRIIRAGEMYRVRISRFAGQVIDVGYELKPVTGVIRAGVVTEWCELDDRGEARLTAPVEHPPGMVRITRIRSVTRNSRWYRAAGAIQVIPADEL